MIFFTLPCAPPLRPAVPVAGHASRSNKVVPNGNPCQIVSIMAEFPRATVPATAPRVLFWQKGRGGTGGAKQEGKQPGSGRRHTAATRAISRGVGQGRGKEQPGKEGQSGKERVAGKTRVTGKTRGRRKIERKKQACVFAGPTTRPEGRTNS